MFPHNLAHGHTVSRFDHCADHVALASDRADHSDFSTRSWNMFPLVGMAVNIPATDKGLVNLNLSHQLGEASIFHRRSDAMALGPGSLVRPTPDDSPDLQGANAFLALKHQVDDLNPYLERIVRTFKNRLGKDRETITVPSAACIGLANPVKRAGL